MVIYLWKKEGDKSRLQVLFRLQMFTQIKNECERDEWMTKITHFASGLPSSTSSFVRPPLPSSPLPIVGTAPARPPLLSVQKATACTPILSPTHALSASSFRSRESSPLRPCPPSPPPRSPRRRPRRRRSVPGRPCPSPLHLHRPRRRPPRAAAAHEAIAFAQPLSAHPRLRSPIAPSPNAATRHHPGPVRLWPVDRN